MEFNYILITVIHQYLMFNTIVHTQTVIVMNNLSREKKIVLKNLSIIHRETY